MVTNEISSDILARDYFDFLVAAQHKTPVQPEYTTDWPLTGEFDNKYEGPRWGGSGPPPNGASGFRRGGLAGLPWPPRLMCIPPSRDFLWRQSHNLVSLRWDDRSAVVSVNRIENGASGWPSMGLKRH